MCTAVLMLPSHHTYQTRATLHLLYNRWLPALRRCWASARGCRERWRRKLLACLATCDKASWLRGRAPTSPGAVCIGLHWAAPASVAACRSGSQIVGHSGVEGGTVERAPASVCQLDRHGYSPSRMCSGMVASAGYMSTHVHCSQHMQCGQHW